MKITIQTPGFKATEDLIQFVNEKVQKLDQFSDRIMESQILLKLDKSDNRENKICELKVIIPGNDLFISKQSKSFEESTAKAIESMKRQITDWKEKIAGV